MPITRSYEDHKQLIWQPIAMALSHGEIDTLF